VLVGLQLYFIADDVFPMVNVFLWLHSYESKCCCLNDKVLLSLSFSSCKLSRFYLLFFRSIVCFWFYTLPRFCSRGFPGWPIDKSSSPSISSHHESGRPSFVCIFIQFLLNLLIFPFCSYPLLCVSGSILCHVSVLAGSRCGELTNHHLHLYLHIMSLTDRRSFAYLANFMNAGSRIGAIELW
jgi:hypothetical protein